MANRVRLTVVTALALLNVFALGAGVAVAAMLPSRLALWQVPRVATVRIAAPAAVLTPAVSAGRQVGDDHADVAAQRAGGHQR